MPDDPTARAVAQALTIFVPGKLGNPMNGSHGHWRTRSRWAKEWRTRTCVMARALWAWPDCLGTAETPKRVTFVAHTYNPVDDDAIPAMLKPCRDGLVDAGILHDDGPHSGHQFVYAQCVDRKRRGVAIEVRLVQFTVSSDCVAGRG